MGGKFKHLIKHSLIYSISNLASKASGLILLPIYTSYFTVEEFGRLGLLLITILIISQIIQLGQNQSVVRLVTLNEYLDKKKSVFFSIFLFILIIVSIFFIVSFLTLQFYPKLISSELPYNLYLKLCLYIICLFVINNIFMNQLRANEESGIYTVLNLIKLSAVLVVSIYLIIVKGIGIESVLYAQLIGEVMSFLVVLPKMLRQMEFKFDFEILKVALKFGLPLIFSTLAINLLNGSDRYMLKFLAGEKAIGLYELGYRVASILNMLIVTPLGISLLPSAYKMYKQEGDKKYYSNLLTYLTIGLVWAGVIIAFWGREIILIFALNSDFYPASEIVPIIILSFVFFGLSMVGSLGMYLTGKTVFIALITFAVAILNIFLNYLFIPDYGMTGAAVNSSVSFLILFILLTFVGNRYYKIPFEYLKVFGLIFSGIMLYLVVNILESQLNVTMFFVVKISLIIIYPFGIYFSNILSINEKIQLKSYFHKSKFNR